MSHEDHEDTKDTKRGQIDDVVEKTATRVIGAAIEVHRVLGPGYGENVYEQALAAEFEIRGIAFDCEVRFSLSYKGRPVGQGRLDFLVENCLVVELKAVEALSVLHTMQVVAYLQATGHRLGLLINFNVPVMKAGIRRVVL